jgi:hypothetical protein
VKDHLTDARKISSRRADALERKTCHRAGLLFGAAGDAVEHRGFGRPLCKSCFMLSSVPSTLLERCHRILVDAALGSKGWEVQRIKPSLALPLRAVEAELITAADPAVAQGPLVERRRSIAVLQPPAPIANGRQGPLHEAARAPRPMRNSAPTAVRGLRVDCSHISTPNAIEPASSYAGDVQSNLLLQTRVSHPRLRDFHAVNGYLPPLGAVRAQLHLPFDGWRPGPRPGYAGVSARDSVRWLER